MVVMYISLELTVLWPSHLMHHSVSISPSIPSCYLGLNGHRSSVLVYWFCVACVTDSSDTKCTINTVSRASNFCDLSRTAKLNTSKFLELPITIRLSAYSYQHFRDIICNILGNMLCKQLASCLIYA